MLQLLLKPLVFGGGILLILITVLSAVRTLVLPRNENVLINSWIFTGLRFVFDTVAALGRTYAQRDRVMALYAPIGLVALPIVWLAMLSVAYTGIFWALGEGNIDRCFRISNSSLLTLGSEEPSRNLWANMMSYSEAMLGLLLLTLLLSYLPTMYQAFSRREIAVSRLQLRAGSEASALELVLWMNRTGSLGDDRTQWQDWEQWFVEIEESHTSLPILSFFRSPQPGRSWVTASGLILDAAALIASSVQQPRDPHLTLCFKAGCIAVNRVARFFHYEEPAPEPNAPASHLPTPEAGFQESYQSLREAGIPVNDEAAAWEQYHHLKARYSGAIAFLSKLIMAPGGE
ncbi:hypothetical protein [Hymenobacter psychrophilus]|uniref:Two pore domain potassium channel family protein n=1 Tax=Hymenobacter psychrophilus TaxID=651662 RepID=A0A1H3JR61_9BACT|nr:hypothetical protein [Hymenobacter psychrophilus]SDY42450.1 hypothetical protein SAMN04488069_108188 [Hymenobacter psychrophilus]